MLLASDPPLQTMRCIGCRNWEALMLTKENDIRVIWDNYGLPLPSNGAVILAPFNYSARQLLFDHSETVFNWFRVATLPPADHLKPDLPLPQPVHFTNGTTVLGFLREFPDSLPLPGKPWAAHMLWRVDNPETEYYKLFVHLVDRSGIKAQVDPPATLPGQQNTGELVLSPLEFQVATDLPTTGPLFLRFGMYNDTGQAEVIAATVDHPDLLQIRGSSRPLATMRSGLELDNFSTQPTLIQGPPLHVVATWRTPSQGTINETLRLNWQLDSPDNLPVFKQITHLLPKTEIKNLPANLFITENYSFRVPTNLEPGKHRLTLNVSESIGDSPVQIFSEYIDIIPRERVFQLPQMQTNFGATFASQISLAGYDLHYSNQVLTVKLHWQALGQIPLDYTYFIHVWDKNEMVAQADAMPASYQYPTSWWAAHEVFTDTIELDLGISHPDEISVTVGLYNAETGARLPVVLGDGSVSSDEWATLLPLAVD